MHERVILLLRAFELASQRRATGNGHEEMREQGLEVACAPLIFLKLRRVCHYSQKGRNKKINTMYGC